MVTSNVQYVGAPQKDWREIATNPDLVRCLVATAERGKQLAQALSAEFTETGHYASSFRVEAEIQTYNSRRGVRTRAAALLVNDAEYAAALEDGWGPVGRPPAHHVLLRVKHLLENST